MRLASITEFRDHATKMFRATKPILVTWHGKKPVGVYYPCRAKNLPKEIRWQIFKALASDIAKELKSKKLTEDDLLRDFEDLQK